MTDGRGVSQLQNDPIKQLTAGAQSATKSLYAGSIRYLGLTPTPINQGIYSGLTLALCGRSLSRRQEQKEEEFMSLSQGDMSVFEYESKFVELEKQD